MNASVSLPSIDTLKTQAKRLRTTLSNTGTSIGHSQALELLAHQHGFQDWNTLHAALGNQPPTAPVTIGQRVRGRYLGQAFEGEVVGVLVLSSADRFRVTFLFDNAVDVITFEGMSNYRKRVTCTVDRHGTTAEKTSDGRPQLSIDRQT